MSDEKTSINTYRRDIVGLTTISRDHIDKEKIAKHGTTQKITRYIANAQILSCGHTRIVDNPKTRRPVCWTCYEAGTTRSITGIYVPTINSDCD